MNIQMIDEPRETMIDKVLDALQAYPFPPSFCAVVTCFLRVETVIAEPRLCGVSITSDGHVLGTLDDDTLHSVYIQTADMVYSVLWLLIIACDFTADEHDRFAQAWNLGPASPYYAADWRLPYDPRDGKQN